METNLEEIVKKAIEGGYEHNCDLSGKLMLLDPLFWQSLGKACGWGAESECQHRYPPNGDGTYSKICKNCGEEFDVEKTKNWLEHALRFHEINLAEGWSKAVEYLTKIIQ